jgi:S-DNA-T family DNA segregation ATPase FtsK/SpoIIIE
MATLFHRSEFSRQIVSPTFRAQMRRRMAELGGLFLGLSGLVLLMALASYNPHDPSLDTATGAGTRNLAGPAGALFADIMLQGFGFAGVLPALAMLVWAWRIAAHRSFGALPLRLIGLALAVVSLALQFAEISTLLYNAEISWPTLAGPGGAVGGLFAVKLIEAGRGLLGPVGVGVVVLLSFPLTAGLTLLALGLSMSEWRAALRAIWLVCRFIRQQIGRVWMFGHALARFVGILLAPLWWVLGRRGEPEAAMSNSPLERPIRKTLSPPPVEKKSPPLVRTPPQPAKAKRAASPQAQLPLREQGWQFPPLSLLKPPPARSVSGPSVEALQANARLLESVLSDYGVQGAIREIRPGPVVTLYELEPAPGIRSARVIGLADDVARSLSVTAVRIATVPGRNVIGIEVPNAKRETVFLSELLSSAEWQRHPGKLPLALGKDISGAPVVADLARMPHLLIAGTTGSGKSVGVNAMILSLLYRLSPEECRLILIDPKMLELSVYEGIPHLMAPVVTEPAKAVTALKWVVREMERRYRAMSQLGVRNIGGYNERVLEARARGEVVTRRVQTGFDPETGKPIFEDQPLALESLPFIVVVIDEMADLMMVAGKEIETAVQRLAQMARAAGIHVIMATQRPSVDVITGTIKANFPTRISFQVISKFDSRTILGEQGAEQLLGQGDMLYMVGGGRITRTHGPFVSDSEVEEVVNFLREQGEPSYLEEVTEPQEEENVSSLPGLAAANEGDQALYDQAVALVIREGKASTSFIQRHLQIGYNRAARLIEQMEKSGIVGPANHVGKREVLARRVEQD